MKGRLVVALLSLFAWLGTGSPALAAPKKKPAKRAQEAPQSTEISKVMGDLKWGTERAAVLERFMNAVREKYRPLIAKATGAIEEDKLRARQRDELDSIRSSMIDFDGQKTGWDVSFLRGEFTHHNGESLFVVKDDTSENYYFFIRGRLWKWYKAFNASTFEGKTFDQFADAIEERYGRGQKREGELTPGNGATKWLEWQDATTRLRAVDNTAFYGFYCLVFEEKATLARLGELRTAPQPGRKATNSMVEDVTNLDDPGEPNDSNQDIADRITGKIRRKQQAPAAEGK